MGLKVGNKAPLFAVVSRLTSQKAWLVLEALLISVLIQFTYY